MKKILSSVFSRKFVFIILLLFQILFLLATVYVLKEKYYIVHVMLMILDALLMVFIVNKKDPSVYKLSWIILMSFQPVFGGLTYVFYKLSQRLPKAIEEKYREQAREYLEQDAETFEELSAEYPDYSNIVQYISEYGLYPVYNNTHAEYYPIGEMQFEALKRELETAERFIFLEYFICSEGYMFETVAEILIRKAAQGVDVRFMYDGIGTGMMNSSKIFRPLIEGGVKCRPFNPFRPFLSSIQNNRDHRKIIVIDGITAFTGGTNLADEYINRKERFGHWKDTAVMIKGEAVWNFTVMFMQLWDNIGILDEWDNIGKLNMYTSDTLTTASVINDGYVQPFSDSPLDNEPVGRTIYLDLIYNARDSICITTPYLILDQEFIDALGFAAKKGVDVKIITPHIPDKWYVYMIAWNTYPKLIETGVKIYEYTPGFIHAKSCIADENIAVVGTINFDFRSFYLHFECAAVLYGCSVIKDIQSDFIDTLELSQQITLDDCKKRPLRNKIAGSMLNMFAPLL